MFDLDSQVALLRVQKFGYHKLPGGGIDAGEDIIKALNRELMEEIGCTTTIGREVGQVDEYRDQTKLFQESFCYLAEVVGEKGQPDYTADELENGLEILWVKSIDEAISLINSDMPLEYAGKFIQARDLKILQAAEALISPR